MTLVMSYRGYRWESSRMVEAIFFTNIRHRCTLISESRAAYNTLHDGSCNARDTQWKNKSEIRNNIFSCD